MGTDILSVKVVGRPNVGKSRLINCIFDREKFKINNPIDAITQSRSRSVILLPNGSPIMIEILVIDDKVGHNKSMINYTLNQISDADFTIVVIDAREELYKSETELIAYLQNNRIPFLIAVNKIEFGTNPHLLSELDALEVNYFELSCKENAGIESFRKTLIHMLPD